MNRFRIGSKVRIACGCDSQGRIGKITAKDPMDGKYCVTFFDNNEVEWFTTMWFERV
ncbi:MAG: hypothetical protein MJZ34_08290 [Paludibacteraceae bacterium]|nr:hypothetical protein [Paludibacteraceae bacterium]